MLAAKHAHAHIPDPPWTLTGDLAVYQMGGVPRRRAVPVEIEIQKAQRMREACRYQVFVAVRVADYQRSGD